LIPIRFILTIAWFTGLLFVRMPIKPQYPAELGDLPELHQRPSPGEGMLYLIYQILIGLLFYISLPLLFLLVLITGKHRQGLSERLGLYGQIRRHDRRDVRVWLHAASVGEVRAARAIIHAVRKRMPRARFILTTMTIHGKRVATEQLAPDVLCILAPLDVPLIVDHVLKAINPDIYVCLETELWPLLLHKAAARGVKLVLVNGRMSEKSYWNYRKIRCLITGILEKFTKIAVISEADRERYLAVGAGEKDLSVEGNVKYDLSLPDDAEAVKESYRSMLNVPGGLDVLVSGSTHTGEEELLVPLYMRLHRDKKLLWIIAPRHMERLPAIMELLRTHQLGFHRFSELQKGGRRQAFVIILDSLGDLADIYAVATYVFCGGSLVARGGHNMMEAAIWDKPVFYGPSIGDFRDAAELLESVRAGFRVDDVQALEETIRTFRNNPEEYTNAGLRAGDIARRQQGAAERQAAIIVECIEGEE
jgi:3-deoxy-D-manno-octulosonic-acid transferase